MTESYDLCSMVQECNKCNIILSKESVFGRKNAVIIMVVAAVMSASLEKGKSTQIRRRNIVPGAVVQHY